MLDLLKKWFKQFKNPIARISATNIMKNTKTNDQTHLEAMIRQQKQLNDSLRASANNLHLIVQKLSGDYPNLIFEYDNQEKAPALSHIDKLELNLLDYEAIQKDINYSLENLERSI